MVGGEKIAAKGRGEGGDYLGRDEMPCFLGIQAVGRR